MNPLDAKLRRPLIHLAAFSRGVNLLLLIPVNSSLYAFPGDH
jgi:hypothetical protein